MGQLSPDDFIKEMEGCIKEGHVVIDPLKLKEIWSASLPSKR
jgi:hypothetical protein